MIRAHQGKLARLRRRLAADTISLHQYRRWRGLHLRKLKQIRYVPPPPRHTLRKRIKWLLFGKKNTRKRKQWLARKYRWRRRLPRRTR